MHLNDNLCLCKDDIITSVVVAKSYLYTYSVTEWKKSSLIYLPLVMETRLKHQLIIIKLVGGELYGGQFSSRHGLVCVANVSIRGEKFHSYLNIYVVIY